MTTKPVSNPECATALMTVVQWMRSLGMCRLEVYSNGPYVATDLPTSPPKRINQVCGLYAVQCEMWSIRDACR